MTMKCFRTLLGICILLTITQTALAIDYSESEQVTTVYTGRQRFDGLMFGIKYDFLSSRFRIDTQNIFRDVPPVKYTKYPSQEALDAYVGYGLTMGSRFYLGLRTGAQVYTQSHTKKVFNAGSFTDIYEAKDAGYIDLTPGLIFYDAEILYPSSVMLYPVIGFSNTRYVFKGFSGSTKFRDESKWGKAYRYGAGIKLLLNRYITFDINVLNQTGKMPTWPAIGIGNVETIPLDENKRQLDPSSYMLNLGFEILVF